MRLFPLLICSIAIASSASADAGDRKGSETSEAIAKVRPVWVQVQLPSEAKPRTQTVNGVFVDPGGLIVVPCLELEKSASLKLIMDSGSKLTAKVIVADAKIGVAILKAESDQPFPHAQFADSDTVEVGATVVVVSGALGFDHTASVGIISPPKTVGSPTAKLCFRWIRAGPGFGPGIVFNMNGSFLGVLPKGGGIGLAVPSNRVKALASTLSKQPNDK